ncbi:PAQR family membrane homeostasis protein TrhA [Planctomicrobium sp. SH668]|uniref:PAQR family membrane homeostasis protein TrhA n=1 Tax=Planctomicrobium sp. SH668 TaxID=3448126 RepID=UPI003F5B8F0C
MATTDSSPPSVVSNSTENIGKITPQIKGIERAIRPPDEFANFLTHGLGFVGSLLAAAWLIRHTWRSPDPWIVVACVAYSVSLVALYAASMLSHAFYDVKRRHFYRKIDQICIFFLITGTYTPFAAVYLRHGYWPILTISMWCLAAAGAYSILKTGYLSATGQKLYLLLGWFPAMSLFVIAPQANLDAVLWIVAGGLLYSFGSLFLWYDNRARYLHSVWHMFVVAGSAAHFIAISMIV